VLANASSSEAICAAGPKPQLLAFYIMVCGVSLVSRRRVWPAKLCAVAQVLNVAFLLFRALPKCLLLTSFWSYTSCLPDRRLRARSGSKCRTKLPAITLSEPKLEAVEQDRIAHIPLTRSCLRMQSEESVPAPATTQHRLMHITCPDFQRMAMIWTSLHHHGPQSQAYKPSRSRCPAVYQSS